MASTADFFAALSGLFCYDCFDIENSLRRRFDDRTPGLSTPATEMSRFASDPLSKVVALSKLPVPSRPSYLSLIGLVSISHLSISCARCIKNCFCLTTDFFALLFGEATF